MVTSPPGISIVIATRNRLSSLKRCVESIRAQDYPKERMELVIVSDGSTDETPEYLSALAAQEPWIKVIAQTRGWQAHARNKGILLSSGELIAITDDDCVVTKDWLLSIASAMQNPKISGVGGHVQTAGNSLVARYIDHVRSLDPPLLPDGSPQMLITANACFRRGALEQIGLFDETFGAVSGEDTEMSLRMRRKGMKLKFVPACRVAHWFEPDVKIFLGRFYRYGLGGRQLFDKHHAWEYWFPQANARLQTLFNGLGNGNVQFRPFYEVEDPAIRPWYCFLVVLQRLSFLAGYLSISSIEQFLNLQQPGTDKQCQKSSDWIPAEPVEVRRKQAAAIFQAFLVDELPSFRLEKGQAGSEIQFDQNVFPPLESGKLQFWICAIVNMIGIDILLELAASYYPPHSVPGIPDASLSASARRIYTLYQRRRKDAYARQHKDLLSQIMRQPGGATLTSIEALCYEKSINVDRFLSWYGDTLGPG